MNKKKQQEHKNRRKFLHLTYISEQVTRQKINNEAESLNDTFNKTDLTDKDYLPPVAVQYTFFSTASRQLFRTHHL